jgi:hypothetical protein
MHHVRVPAFTAGSALDLISSQSVAHVIWFRLQLIVILMSTDPSPKESVALDKATHRTIMLAYSR